MLKRNLIAFSITSVIVAATLPSNAATNNTNSTNNNSSFLQQISQQYLQVKNYIKGLTTDFSQGWGALGGEVQSQIDKTVGDLGIPDMVRAGKNIENTISQKKTDVSNIDPGIQGKTARHEWDETYTKGQSQGILGAEGQKAMNEENQVSQTAVDTSASHADAAQNDVVTQDIMKRIAIQNFQQMTVLKLMQEADQQQTKIAAAANVNLADMSQNMTIEQKRKQNENQGAVNVTYKNAAFGDGFWNENTK